MTRFRTTDTTSPIELHEPTSSEATGLRAIVEDVYRRSYVEAIESGHRFHDADVFMSRFDSHVRAPRFHMLMAWRDGEAVGQAWGWGENSEWQDELESSLSSPLAADLSGPSFALAEIMTVKEARNTGVARTLHDTLLERRPEHIATLFVEPENTRAYRLYRHWGWRRVGTSTPALPDAPTFDVLALRKAPASARGHW